MNLQDLLTARRLTDRPGAARALREAAGISLRQLAAFLEVSPSALSRWERGARRPRGELAVRWAAALADVAAALEGASAVRQAGVREEGAGDVR